MSAVMQCSHSSVDSLVLWLTILSAVSFQRRIIRTTLQSILLWLLTLRHDMWQSCTCLSECVCVCVCVCGRTVNCRSCGNWIIRTLWNYVSFSTRVETRFVFHYVFFSTREETRWVCVMTVGLFGWLVMQLNSGQLRVNYKHSVASQSSRSFIHWLCG